jgi:hypothetical protein
MAPSDTPEDQCVLCGEQAAESFTGDSPLCMHCGAQAEALFEQEMRNIEFIRRIRGQDVEVYDIRHPHSLEEMSHCGQVVLIRVGHSFEVKISLRSEALDWMSNLRDESSGFVSVDKRMEALIGNISLLIESWGGGPYYMDIYYVDKMFSTEGEI